MNYALKGINDEESKCYCCGKVELSKVMWLVEIDENGEELSDAFPVGTTCGAKMLKKSKAKVLTSVKNYPSKVIEAKQKAKRNHPLTKEVDTNVKKLNDLKLMGVARLNHPLMIEINKLNHQIDLDVDSMTFLIEI